MVAPCSEVVGKVLLGKRYVGGCVNTIVLNLFNRDAELSATYSVPLQNNFSRQTPLGYG